MFIFKTKYYMLHNLTTHGYIIMYYTVLYSCLLLLTSCCMLVVGTRTWVRGDYKQEDRHKSSQVRGEDQLWLHRGGLDAQVTVAPATLHLRPKSTSIVAQSAGATLSRPFSPFLLHFTLFTHCLLFFSRITSKFIQVNQTLLYPFAEICLFLLRPLILYGFSASFRIFFPCVCSVTIESEPFGGSEWSK